MLVGIVRVNFIVRIVLAVGRALMIRIEVLALSIWISGIDGILGVSVYWGQVAIWEDAEIWCWLSEEDKHEYDYADRVEANTEEHGI